MKSSQKPLVAASPTPREEKLRKFFRGKENICPFGREAAERGVVRFVEVSALMPQEQIFDAARALAAGEAEALAVVSPSDPGNHELGRIEAYSLHIELSIAMARIAEPAKSLDEISAAWMNVRTHIASGAQSEALSALIGSGRLEEQLYAIAMGPQFGAMHPRFSPHLCLVVIGAAALEKAAEENPGMAASIRERVKARLRKTGSLQGDTDAPRLIVGDEFYSVSARAVSEADYEAHAQQQMAAMVAAHRAASADGQGR